MQVENFSFLKVVRPNSVQGLDLAIKSLIVIGSIITTVIQIGEVVEVRIGRIVRIFFVKADNVFIIFVVGNVSSCWYFKDVTNLLVIGTVINFGILVQVEEVVIRNNVVF